MVSESFKDFILDQLNYVDGVTARRMFGGFGLYAGKIFFGLIADDQLYFKTNQNTRERYLAEDMKPFTFSPKQILKNYYQVPVDIIENRENIYDWASEAIAINEVGER